MRPLLVGLMPNRSNTGPTLGGAIGKKLREWSGIQMYEFDAVNLNSHYGRRLNLDEAIDKSIAISNLAAGAPVVYFGVEVGKIFDHMMPFWQWTGFNTVMVPHPSGRCRLYNDPENRRRTGTTLNEALQRCAEYNKMKKEISNA